MTPAESFAQHLLAGRGVDAGQAVLAMVDGRAVTVARDRPDAALLAARRRTPLVWIGGDDVPDPPRRGGDPGPVVVRVGGPPLALAQADLSVTLAPADLADHGPPPPEDAVADHGPLPPATAVAEHGELPPAAAVADHGPLPPDDAAATVRRFLSLLAAHTAASPPASTADLTDVVPFPLDETYEVEPVLACLLDGSCGAVELRPRVAPEVVTALGRVGGHGVGVVASRTPVGRGRLRAAGAHKVARLVRLCARLHRPVVFLVDSEGVVAPAGGGLDDLETLARAWAAVHGAAPLKLAVLAGRACGLGATILGGVGARADLVAAWPRAEVALATPETDAQHAAASVLRAARSGEVLDVIDPNRTRAVLIEALELMRGERTYNRD